MSHSGKLYTGLTAWSCTASDGTSSITGRGDAPNPRTWHPTRRANHFRKLQIGTALMAADRPPYALYVVGVDPQRAVATVFFRAR